MTNLNPLDHIEMNWKRRLYLKVLAWLILFGVFMFIWVNILAFLPIAFPAFLLIMVLMIVRERKNWPDRTRLIALVDSQVPELEYSSQLLDEEGTNGLRALQQRKIQSAVHSRTKSISYPVLWKDFFSMTLILGLVLLVGYNVNSPEEEVLRRTNNEVVYSKVDGVVEDSIFMVEQEIQFSPPAYMNETARKTTGWDIEIPEGSLVSWKLTFNGVPNGVWALINQDSIPLDRSKDNWVLNLRPKEDAIYSIRFRNDAGEIISTPFYELRILPDEAPIIQIEGIPQYQRLDYAENMRIKFDIGIEDDYGLEEGYLVATITKGAGESVMFREQRLELNRAVKGRSHSSTMELRPDDFEMEPGNELYFYVEARDNKEPVSQIARTETYFFILRDTVEVEFSLQGSLGVDLMPDFFRSQLQIIMDTEKLVEERADLSKKDFNSTSNALGFDQKQLRLKYGQFIGEEEDSGLEVDREDPEIIESPSADNVLQDFGHDHDHENEEGQLMDKGTEHHDHDHHDHGEELDSEAEEDPLEAFLHNHEDEETATFFTQTLKSKLRAALTQMWDAELYLRLFEPEKSLPYQYEAHRLLKEIKNHARIYVQRIGFDPPPVNEEESRLTGKLKEINKSPFTAELEEEKGFVSIRKAIAWMAKARIDQEITKSEKDLLQDAGSELAQLAIEQPYLYLKTLNDLRWLINQLSISTPGLTKVRQIREVLISALPSSTIIPDSDELIDDDLNLKFLEVLTQKSK